MHREGGSRSGLKGEFRIFNLKGLLDELVANSDGQLKPEITQMAAYYEHKLQLGNKAIFHLEAFVAKFMCTHKRFIEEGLTSMAF